MVIVGVIAIPALVNRTGEHCSGYSGAMQRRELGRLPSARSLPDFPSVKRSLLYCARLLLLFLTGPEANFTNFCGSPRRTLQRIFHGEFRSISPVHTTLAKVFNSQVGFLVVTLSPWCALRDISGSPACLS